MKEKMAKFLQELYSNLGLPKSTIESVAGFAIIGLQESATDDEIKARASEESVKTMLQSFQSDLDRARSGKGGNKGGNDPEPPANPPQQEPKEEKDGDVPEWVRTMMEKQNETISKLSKKIDGMEKGAAQKSYEDRVNAILAEYKLSADVSALCKMGLSADMDDAKIRETIGKNVKTLQDAGAVVGGGSTVDVHAQEQAHKAELDADAKEFLAKVKAEQEQQGNL